jgi:multiple antibiotic resistance protein
MISSSTIAFAILAFTSLLAIINPLGAIPLYVAATAELTNQQRAATLRRAVITGVTLLFLFGFLGTYILTFFGVTTYAFRIAGGIIFFGIGSDMLQARRPRGKTTRSEEEEAGQKQDIGIIPLGIPLLAGPGAISTIITLSSQADTPIKLAAVYLAIVAVMAVAWVVLTLSPKLVTRVGQTGLNIMTRIMGLLVMVIGIQFVIEGVRTVAIDILVRG